MSRWYLRTTVENDVIESISSWDHPDGQGHAPSAVGSTCHDWAGEHQESLFDPNTVGSGYSGPPGADSGRWDEDDECEPSEEVQIEGEGEDDDPIDAEPCLPGSDNGDPFWNPPDQDFPGADNPWLGGGADAFFGNGFSNFGEVTMPTFDLQFANPDTVIFNGNIGTDLCMWSAHGRSMHPPFVATSRTFSSLRAVMIDVDGDGLQDYAESEGAFWWWKNTGSGFIEMCGPGGCEELSALSGGLHVTWSDTTSSGTSTHSWSSTARGDVRFVRDIDQDGALDVVDVWSGGVAYGEHRAPGALVQVNNGRGLQTTLTYLPASAMEPAGSATEVVNEWNNVRAHLVVQVDNKDWVTDSQSTTKLDYADRVCRYGKCLGFQSQHTQVFAPEHTDINAGRFTLSTEPMRWHSEIDSFYVLTRDHQLLSERFIAADHRNGFTRAKDLHTQWVSGGPGIMQVAEHTVDRYHEVHTWIDQRQPDEPPRPEIWEDRLPLYRLEHRTLTEYAEVGSGERTLEMNYLYDAEGLLVYADELSDDASRFTDFSLAPNTSDGTQRLLTRSRVTGDGGPGEETQYQWSPDGTLDVERLCLQNTAGSCTGIDFRFHRNLRGAVNGLIEPPLGAKFSIPVFRYGGAIPGVQEDGVGLKTRAIVNDRGQVTKQRDPAGVRTLFEYDDLGRVVSERVMGAGGTEARVTKIVRYLDLPIAGTEMSARAVQTLYYNEHLGDDPSAVTGELAGGTVVISDGSGTPRQTWSLGPYGAWVVTDSFTDVFGNLRATTHPSEQGLWPAGATLQTVLDATGAELLTWTDYDAFGAPRIALPDVTNHPQCATYSVVTNPGEVHTIAPTGLEKRVSTDALGRVVEVREQGAEAESGNDDCPPAPADPAALQRPVHLTGSYTWTATDQLESFTYPTGVGVLVSAGAQASTGGGASGVGGLPGGQIEAVPVTVSWSYDRAGRQVGVRRSVDGGAITPWKSFDHKGTLPVRMYEGANTGAVLIAVTLDEGRREPQLPG